MARAIAFKGVDATVDAYELNRIGPWAVLSQGKILCSSNDVADDDVDEGSAQLEQFLDMLKKHGSQSVFELQVYKLGPGQVDITSKTPYSRSIPFSLFENQETGLTNTDNRLVGLLTKIEERMVEMELRIKTVELAEDEAEEPKDDGTMMGKIGSMAMGFLERPDVQQAIAIGAMNLVKKYIPAMGQTIGAAPQEGRKVAGVQTEYVNLLDQDQINKVHDAITRLSTRDPKLGDHMQQLAKLSETDPDKYNWGLKFL